VSDRLPLPFGPSVLAARIRATPEDFLVEELDAFAPDGAGEHLLLTIEKRGMNTAFAAQRIAAWAGVPESAIGYAGMKDRHAVTRQRFSVHLPGREAPDVATLVSDDMRVLAEDRHARKLQRGALRGNRFVLTLREVVGELESIEHRLAEIATHGFPNYFGEQRFGHGGGNLEAAQRMFAGQRVRRDKRSLLLSAARSELFNVVLALRVADGSWCRGLPGELWMLAGSRSVFGPEPDPGALAARVAAHDVHPSGPLWGLGELRTDGACRALEETALALYEPIRVGLEQAGLKQERRALRTIAGGLVWKWLQPDVLRLGFELPPGSYATSLLRSLGEVVDASERAVSGTTNDTLRSAANGVD
jgi:tRNA pseudouridine13 synthase